MQDAALRVSALAGDVRSALTALQSAVDRLPPIWQGRARAAFDEVWSGLDRELAHSPRMLDQIAQALRDTAQRIGVADAQAGLHITQRVVDDTQ